MNSAIQRRIVELGGRVVQPEAPTLHERLASVTFPHPLYKRPVDTPWASAEQAEPIFGLGDFVERHRQMLMADKDVFYTYLIDHYYAPTEEFRGQVDYRCELFTPLREGSADYQEWGQGEEFDLAVIEAQTGLAGPDFLFIGFSEGYPTHYFVCPTDPTPENPRVFSTDHTVYLDEINDCGSLESWLNGFMTASELIDLVERALAREVA